MPVLPVDQRTEGWYEARAWRITASMAAACLGLDPWTGPLAAFNQITGKVKRGDNAHMKWGREKEATARTAYEIISGNLVDETGFWLHPKYDWLGASPDGLIGDKGLVEVKCPSNKLPDVIPSHHEVQMMVQMACCERDWCDYLAWMPDGYFLARLERDPVQEDYLLKRLEEFWENHIKPDIAPPRRRPT